MWKILFLSVSWCILLRYEDNFSLKKCSKESVEEKVAENIKENWNSKFVLKFNDIRLQKLRFFQKSQFFTCITTMKIFLPQLHQWNFSAVVARWPYNLKVHGSSPVDTTIFSFLCTEKGFLVSQLDVIQKQKWTDGMNADKNSFLELPSNPMEHFFKVPLSSKV